MFGLSFLKKCDFFEMLYSQALKTEEGLAALSEFMENPTKENGNRVDALEEEADEIRRVLIDNLNRTFVTPIDREDIFSLSHAIDDVIDYAKSTVEEIILFEAEPDANMKEMVNVLHEATKDVAYGVKHMKANPGACVEHNIRAKKAENKIERLYRKGLAELFQTKDVIKILKSREVYRHLSNAADRIVTAASIIGDILVKYT
jgi:hypothetical protein